MASEVEYSLAADKVELEVEMGSVAESLDDDVGSSDIVRGLLRAPSFFPTSIGGMGPEADGTYIPSARTGRERSLTFSATAPANSPAVLVWRNLTVTTKTNPPKVLLHNLSGQITGGFWAIMGGSGGGKTTLLSTISLRLDKAKMETTGQIHLNGYEYNTGILKNMSAYVMQDDLLHAELTVRETIKYAADLRLAGQMDAVGREQRQTDVMNLMGIGHVADVIIGDTQRKGISGGERKRVCIAIELLTAPKLLFLDEVSPFSFMFCSLFFLSL